MGSIRKNRIFNFSFSKLRKNISQTLMRSKPFQYIRAFFHIILKLQPFVSIATALIVVIPLSNLFTYAIDVFSAQSQDTEYKEGVIGSMKNIDPLPLLPLDRPFSQVNRDVTRLLFDPLFVTDETGAPKGVLAQSYQVQNNGLAYTVSLADRKWSNGQDVTVDDVSATFNAIKDRGATSLYYPAIDGVEVKKIDNKNFEFDLATANSSFLDTLYWPILPASQLVKSYGDLINGDFGTNPLSNTSWNISNFGDNSVTLVNRDTNKKITFVFYRDVLELENAVNAGFIDGYYSLSPINPKNFEILNKFNLPRQIYSLYFNLSDSGSPFLKDPNVRKAISYALNRDDIVGDLGKVRQSIIQEESWAFNPGVDTYKYNPQKANELLDTAGYKKDGEYRKQGNQDLEFTLSIPELAVRVNQANKIQEQLKAIGIKVDVKSIKDTQYIDNELKGNLFYKSIVLTKNFEAMIYSVDSTLDPDKFTQWHSTKIPNIDKNVLGLNFSGYSDVRVDAYLRQGRNSTDQNTRKTPYMQFQKVFYDDAPVATLYTPYLFYVTTKKVENIDFTGAVRIEDRFIHFDDWKF